MILVDKPEIIAAGNRITFLWHAQGVGIAFDHLREIYGSLMGGLNGEVTVSGLSAHGKLNGNGEHIYWARHNLSSGSAREELARLLKKRTPAEDNPKVSIYPWDDMLEYACTAAARRWRAGEPFVDLATMQRPERAGFLVEKLLPRGQTSVLYSRGGAGKSLMSLALCVAVTTGTSLPGGLRPTAIAPTLYLDHESDEEEQRLRLEWLAKGLGLSTLPSIICRHQTRPIAADLDRIKAEVDEKGIKLVVLDSIAYSLGGSPQDEELVIAAFNALRTLGTDVSRIVVAHIPKGQKDSQQASIFGSVFHENAGRSIWEVISTENRDGFSLALYHRKRNWGKRLAPIGLRFVFDDPAESVRIEATSVEDDPELLSHDTATAQILAALRKGKLTINGMADATGLKRPAVAEGVRRLTAKGEISLVDPGGRGRGNESSYGLAAPDDQGAPF